MAMIGKRFLYEVRAELLHHARRLMSANNGQLSKDQIWMLGEQFAESLGEYYDHLDKIRWEQKQCDKPTEKKD